MAKLIGMGGSITVSSASYPVSEWSIEVANDLQDVVDTGSGGWATWIAGINSADVTFTAFWGSATLTLSTVFAIGTVVAVTLNIGSSENSITGNVIVGSFGLKNNAKNPVEFTCGAKSQGALTLPT